MIKNKVSNLFFKYLIDSVFSKNIFLKNLFKIKKMEYFCNAKIS